MREAIEEATKELRQPAGPEFDSLEAVRTNHRAFVETCHKTWKKWSDKAIGELFTWDAFLKREKEHPVGPLTEEFGEYNRAVWRRVNDAIVWSLNGGERHRVKRLCLYRRRTFLDESNPDAAMAALAQLNADPLAFAMWNDATSCVDIGDITYIENGLKPIPKFIELKEGRVNEAILDVVESAMDPNGDKVAQFISEFGKKGEAQLNRVLRQKKTAEQVLILLDKEKGTDPVTGAEMEVIESPVNPTYYDAQLNDLLKRALEVGESRLDCVDGCLWLFVNADPALKYGADRAKFAELLAERVPGLTLASGEKKQRWDKDKIFSLNQSYFWQIAKPLMLRQLAPEFVAEITYGRLRDRVLIYLDWQSFGALLKKEGAQFDWSTRKETGKLRAMHPRMRPPVINGRVPLIRLREGAAYVTDPMLFEMFFDGAHPITEARRMATETRALAARLKSKK